MRQKTILGLAAQLHFHSYFVGLNLRHYLLTLAMAATNHNGLLAAHSLRNLLTEILFLLTLHAGNLFLLTLLNPRKLSKV